MLDQVNVALQQMKLVYTLLFPDLYIYYVMKLKNFGYDKDFNLLFLFAVFIELCSQKPLHLYQLETLPVPFKYNNTEANSYTWLQPREDYFAMIGEKY